MSAVDNQYSSLQALKEAYTHVDSVNRHIIRARQAQKVIMLVALASISLVVVMVEIVKAQHCSACTVQVIHFAILGSVISLVIGLAITKLVSKHLKHNRDSLLAKMDGQALCKAFLTDPKGAWDGLTNKIKKKQWESWAEWAATQLFSKDNRTDDERSMLEFLHKNCHFLGDNAAFQKLRQEIAVTKT